MLAHGDHERKRAVPEGTARLRNNLRSSIGL